MTTDPADRLTRAAARLRELAEAATPGPWHFQTWMKDGQAPLVIGANMAVAETFDKPHLSDARYIAAMSPPLALAVADWLEYTAPYVPSDPHTDSEACETCDHVRHALAVADVVLGEQEAGT